MCFYIKQYFYYVFIFFQLFFILFSDFCNADSSYVSYNVFLRWHVIIHEITVIFLLITCHTAFFHWHAIGSDITRLSSINYLWHNVFVLRHVIVAQIAIIYCSKNSEISSTSLYRKWRDSFNILNHQIAKGLPEMIYSQY